MAAVQLQLQGSLCGGGVTIKDLVGPIDHDRIRPPSSKDDFVLWICAIPFHLLVVLQFFIIVSFFRCIVRDGQTSPHRPWLVDPHSICPPLFPSPHANSFVIGTAVIYIHISAALADG